MAVAASSSTPSPARAGEPLLRLRGLGRRFGGVHAVRDVDLEVLPGERRAILGPNGAGKSTLFNLIAGDLRPSDGTVELFGRDVSMLPVRKRVKLGLGRTFQTSRVLGGLTVEDNLYLAALGVRPGHLRPLRTGADADLRERARGIAGQVGLTDRLEVLAGSLSHGEQRQVEVGLALASSPRLLMLDEPAAGLSRAERVTLTRMLLGLDPGVTLIIIEHDMDVALTVAERVTMMHDGQVILEGSPAEVRASQLVHDLYLGSAAHGG
jgi:branched-chain amino acid transport system ATP-binding protein